MTSSNSSWLKEEGTKEKAVALWILGHSYADVGLRLDLAPSTAQRFVREYLNLLDTESRLVTLKLQCFFFTFLSEYGYNHRDKSDPWERSAASMRKIAQMFLQGLEKAHIEEEDAMRVLDSMIREQSLHYALSNMDSDRDESAVLQIARLSGLVASTVYKMAHRLQGDVNFV